jgi:hypothetical protein
MMDIILINKFVSIATRLVPNVQALKILIALDATVDIYFLKPLVPQDVLRANILIINYAKRAQHNAQHVNQILNAILVQKLTS